MKKNTRRKRVIMGIPHKTDAEWLSLINEALETGFTRIIWDVPEWKGSKVLACWCDKKIDSEKERINPMPVLVNGESIRIATDSEIIEMLAEGHFSSN